RDDHAAGAGEEQPERQRDIVADGEIHRRTIHGIAISALCMKAPSDAIIQVDPSHTTPSAAASFGANETLESCTWVAACNTPNPSATIVITPSTGEPILIAVKSVVRNKSEAIAEFTCSYLRRNSRPGCRAASAIPMPARTPIV